MTSQAKKKTKQTTKAGNNGQPSASRGRRPSPRQSPVNVPRDNNATVLPKHGTRTVQTRTTNQEPLLALDERNRAHRENWPAAGEKAATIIPSPTTTTTSNQANTPVNVVNVKDHLTSPTMIMTNPSPETQFINQTSLPTSTVSSKRKGNDVSSIPDDDVVDTGDVLSGHTVNSTRETNFGITQEDQDQIPSGNQSEIPSVNQPKIPNTQFDREPNQRESAREARSQRGQRIQLKQRYALLPSDDT